MAHMTDFEVSRAKELQSARDSKSTLDGSLSNVAPAMVWHSAVMKGTLSDLDWEHVSVIVMATSKDTQRDLWSAASSAASSVTASAEMTALSLALLWVDYSVTPSGHAMATVWVPQ